jgi:flagellar protein FlaG
MEIAGISNKPGAELQAMIGVQSATALPAQVKQERYTLLQAVRTVNEAETFGQENELSFAFDRKSQRAIVRIVDRKTREVLQQIPNEKVLRMAEEIQQRE